jgi:hypothetical protein
MTRAAKVEALNECSAYRIIETVNAFTTTGSGTSPNVMKRKFSE